MDLHSKYWANLQLLDPPCNFRARVTVILHGHLLPVIRRDALCKTAQHEVELQRRPHPTPPAAGAGRPALAMSGVKVISTRPCALHY